MRFLINQLILTACICSALFFSACDSSAVPVEPNGCTWVDDSITVIFHDAMLYIPDEDCKLSLDKQGLHPAYPYYGIYNFMNEIANGGYFNTCSFTWISSIFTKKCDISELDENSCRVLLDLTNYTFRLFPSDVLEEAPMVHSSGNMVPTDYKHELILQLQDVHNSDDGSDGTLTWTCAWLGDVDSEYIRNSRIWNFSCPISGIYGAFTPYYGYNRNIYVYNNFINIR